MESRQRHFNVFYSWQSDIDKKANNHFIKDCLEKAIKELSRDTTITVIPRLDKDTQGKTGSPKIADTILSKIDSAHLFIADVTIINKTRGKTKKLTPNPNVLFELGYALYRLGWERIICLNNTKFSQVEDMPFDIRQNRISQYAFDGKLEKRNAEKELVMLLKLAVKGIIEEYDILEEKANEKNMHQHDIKVFEGLNEIMNDTKFIETLDTIGDSQRCSKEDYNSIDKFTYYLQAESNQFLLPDLKTQAGELRIMINKMRFTLSKNFFARTEEWYDEESKKVVKELSYSLPENEEYFDSYEEYEKHKLKRIDQNNGAIDEAIEKYKIFRATIKQQLYI